MSADAAITSGKVKGPAWKTMVKPYQTPENSRGAWQVINSFVPMFILWVLMYLSLDVSYLLTLLLALPTAGMMVRIFIIQHDCGHGSFFTFKSISDRNASCFHLSVANY